RRSGRWRQSAPGPCSARLQSAGAIAIVTAHKATLTGYGVRPSSGQMTVYFPHCVALRADLLPQYARRDPATRLHTHRRVTASGAALRVTPGPSGDTTPTVLPDCAHPPGQPSTCLL